LLTVPRGEDGGSMIREYVVIRCTPRADGKYTIGLELAGIASTAAPVEKRVCGKNVKLLFLALGIVGLLAATFLPLN
jgi:hypothetical protein